MKCDIDYKKPHNGRPAICFLRLYPETPGEAGEMDTVMEIFDGKCRLSKVTMWENTHFIVKLTKKDKSPEKEQQVRFCDQCGAAMISTNTKCPYCGRHR